MKLIVTAAATLSALSVCTPSALALQVSPPLFQSSEAFQLYNLPVAMLSDGRLLAVVRTAPGFDVVAALTREGAVVQSWTQQQIGFLPERLAALPDGGFVVTGFAGGFGGGTHRFRIYNTDGTARTPAPVDIAAGGLQEGGRLVQVLPGGRFMYVWDTGVNSQVFDTPFGEAPGIGPIYPAPFNQWGRDIYARIFNTADGSPAPNAHSTAGDTFLVTQGMYENDPAWPGVRWDTRIEEQWLLDLDLTAAGTVRVTYQGPRWFGASSIWSRHFFGLFRGLQTNGAQFIAEEPLSQQAVIADATMQNTAFLSRTVPLANGRLACLYDEGYYNNLGPRLTLRYFEENGQPVDNGPREPSGAPFGRAIPLFTFGDTTNPGQIDAHPAGGAGCIVFFTATPEGEPPGGPRHAVAALVDGNGRVTRTATIAAGPRNQVIHWVAAGQPGEWFVSLTEGTRAVANEGGSNHRLVRVFDPLTPWALAAGVPLAQAAAADDPDGDDLANLLERATGTLPMVPSPPPIEAVVGPATNTLRFRRDTQAAADGITVELEASEDAALWSSTASLESVVQTDGTVQTVQVSVPATTRGFFRLKARQ
jgi:hypothetical protein